MMKIAISGSTGFIGKQLTEFLLLRGYEIITISRKDFSGTDNQLAKIINSADVIINLAGSSVLCRWNTRNREQILSSRIKTTRMLMDAIRINASDHRPGVFINASAIGIYKESEIHDETSKVFNDDFLAYVCKAWEAETIPLNELEIRNCIIRIGIVLGTTGGTFAKMLPLFKAGLGGKLASGKQPFSFIHINDYCRAIVHIIEKGQSSGIYNLVSPQPTTNEIFTKELACRLNRPALFVVPEIALKIVYGEAAKLITHGATVLPTRLINESFEFGFPDISSAIKELVKKKWFKLFNINILR